MPALRSILIINSLCIAALMSFVAVVGPLVRTLRLAEWHGGLAVTMAGVLWVISARRWGRLSDVRGRKPVLLCCLLGFSLSFLALAGYFDMAQRMAWSLPVMLVLLIFVRGLMGLFYAAIPVVSAAWLADRFPPDERGAAMAKLGAANAVGMVLGPLLAGVLAVRQLSLPMYLATILPLSACLLLWIKVPATAVQQQDEKPALTCTDPRIRLPAITMFLAACTIIAAQMCVGFYAMDRLALNAHDGARVAGQTMAGVGVTLIVTQLLVARLHRVPQLRMIALGALLAAAGFAPLLLTSTTPGLLASYSIAAAGLGMLIPSAQVLAANAVGTHEQGLAAGTLAAAQGMASVVSPLTFTLLYQWHWRAPFLLACSAMILLSVLSFGRLTKRRSASVRGP
ncbi:MFS transporter [Verminephrobacter aporrectodeae subsp. tuberculatae]|uniref:MFS transporter n=1 Tax=Verminephrobacter aporrectodeae TaxID=1110389 RepID=UPI00223734A5|nr:MFS transporter [Verminephrobacter aporrectodeae]MCW5258062.1 MFS transporter [Verminephrobacter aporrectodeae subsp. tuberculatae]